MKEKALEILKILNDHNYEAYIVGGFVRDTLLNRKTTDIDICTSATPKDILTLFEDVTLSDIMYGSVIVHYKGYNYDLTTFRKEIKYENNRRPVKIKYIKDIKKDLLRRDFTINTICIDQNNHIIDYLNAMPDLETKTLKTVGNPKYKIKEDSLRILRCIRFATILSFEIDSKTKKYLSKYGYLLKTLSFSRKREELDKIFLSSNRQRGFALLDELNLTKYLSLSNLLSITPCPDLLGIWCQLDVQDIYPFTKSEKKQINSLKKLLTYDHLDNYLLYEYGLYLCTVYAEIKGLSKEIVNKEYLNLQIKSRKDIQITGREIAQILKQKEGKYISIIIDDIEKQILNNKLNNNSEEIKDYVKDKYS